MRVVMTRHRVWQDVGIERPLEVGKEYDLPVVVASALIATGAAEHAVGVVREAAVAAPPETGARRRKSA